MKHLRETAWGGMVVAAIGIAGMVLIAWDGSLVGRWRAGTGITLLVVSAYQFGRVIERLAQAVEKLKEITGRQEEFGDTT